MTLTIYSCAYDDNGNIISDLNKNNLEINEYNYLNLPQQITIEIDNNTNGVNYLYDAAGIKLRKQTKTNYTVETTTDYIGSFVYEDDGSLELRYILTGEGRVMVNTGGTYEYQYFLKVGAQRKSRHCGNHLGNTRITLNDNGEVIQEDSYYPFGEAAFAAYESASAVLGESEYNITAEDAFKNLSDGVRNDMANNKGKWSYSGVKQNSGGDKADHGAYIGMLMMKQNAKISANGHIKFNFSSYAAKSAIAGADATTMASATVQATMGGAQTGGGGMGFWDGLLLAWDLKVIGRDFPDLISFDITVNSTAVAGASMTYAVNLYTRGERGVNITATEQNRFGGEIDWGLNLNIGYYQGNPLNINQSSVAGPVQSISAGWGYSGQGYFGYDATGKHVWTGFGMGVGLSGGASYGSGRTRIIWP